MHKDCIFLRGHPPFSKSPSNGRLSEILIKVFQQHLRPGSERDTTCSKVVIMESKLSFAFLSLFAATSWTLKCSSDRKEVNEAINKAVSGDIICIENGVYENWMINLKVDGMILTGETGNRVFLKGHSQVKISGKRIIVKNLVFTAPISEGNSRNIPSPIEFAYKAEFNLVSDCMIHHHAANVWVKVRGNNNDVSHCTFKDKPAPALTETGKEIALSNIVSVSDSNMHSNAVHHNKFVNYDPDAKIAKHKHGSAEAVYVKIARSAGRDVRNLGCSVYKNYFYKIDSEEETIGIKSSGNKVYENAIEFCFGGAHFFL